MRLKLIVAYQGEGFSGWQSQPDGNAIQDHLEAAFLKIVGTRVVVQGSGRTDAGVHAMAQCAHAEVADDSLTPAKWRKALNAHLPPAIRIMRIGTAEPDFHARFSAKGKVYKYRVWNGAVLPPSELGRAWHVVHKLDLAAVQAMAESFIGRHDFAAFSANRGDNSTDTVRTIHSINVGRKGDLLTFTFEGEGFLYKMVRMMTTAIVRAGEGREPVEALQARLKDGGPKWNHVAPAEGLWLMRVLY